MSYEIKRTKVRFREFVLNISSFVWWTQIGFNEYPEGSETSVVIDLIQFKTTREGVRIGIIRCVSQSRTLDPPQDPHLYTRVFGRTWRLCRCYDG